MMGEINVKKITALFLILILFSCGSDKGDANKEFAKKGTFELMEEIEKDEYTHPEDGNLTEKQVEMYLAVKKAEVSYAKQAAQNLKQKTEKFDEKEKQEKKPGVRDYITAFKALGDVADFVTADLRAAKKLGYNTKEYQWVRETIIITNVAVWTDTSKKAAAKSFNTVLEQLKQQRDAAATEEQKALFDEQIKSFAETIEEMKTENQEQDGITEHNKKLLDKYKDKIKGLAAELNKWQYLDDKMDSGDE